MPHTYAFPRPSVTVDIVVFSGDYVLLIQRGKDPFKDCWALPGGFVNEGESLIDAARRELFEETGLEIVPLLQPARPELIQVGAFGDPGRDPRGWVVSVAFAGDVAEHCPPVVGRDDARRAEWFCMGSSMPELAFDHQKILDAAVNATVPRERTYR